MSLEVRGVTVRAGNGAGAAGRGARLLVDDVAFSAPSGTLTALLGPNGAGKSTLLRAVAGVERPAAGSAVFEGAELIGMRGRERARRLAFVEQEAATELPLTVRSVVGLGRAPHESVLGGRDPDAEPVIDEAMATVGVEGMAARIVTTLSGGERQRVLLARAIAQQPRLLLLDEPTNHLDVAAQLDTLELLGRLAAEGTTVVAALHDLSLAAAFADHVVVIHGGRRVAEGAPVPTLTPELLLEVYGVRAAWTVNPLDGRPLLALAR